MRRALQVAAVAAAASIIGAFLSPAEAYHAYLWSWWFWIGIAIGCGQLLMLFQLTGGAWGFISQRILEAGTRTLPYMFVLALPLVIGMGAIYPYAQPEIVRGSHALQHKTPYLNVPFVLVRLAVYFAIWWGLAHLMNRWSLKQDETADLKYLRLRKILAGPGIILYSLAVTFAAVDWFMALEPEWFSTMYPGFHLVGQVLTAIAVVIIAARYVAERAGRPEVFTPQAFHDLGNLLLTFVVLWAYVQVAQLVVVWQGNLPKEITWYLNRTRGNWAWIATILVVFHFGLPFFILLSRKSKLRNRKLARIAIYILLIHMLDYYWNVEPAFHSGLYVHWMDFAAPAAVGGVWVALFVRELGRRRTLPEHDPRLEQALERAT